jgi:hypothetical protein
MSVPYSPPPPVPDQSPRADSVLCRQTRPYNGYCRNLIGEQNESRPNTIHTHPSSRRMRLTGQGIWTESRQVAAKSPQFRRCHDWRPRQSVFERQVAWLLPFNNHVLRSSSTRPCVAPGVFAGRVVERCTRPLTPAATPPAPATSQATAACDPSSSAQTRRTGSSNRAAPATPPGDTAR